MKFLHIWSLLPEYTAGFVRVGNPCVSFKMRRAGDENSWVLVWGCFCLLVGLVWWCFLVFGFCFVLFFVFVLFWFGFGRGNSSFLLFSQSLKSVIVYPWTIAFGTLYFPLLSTNKRLKSLMVWSTPSLVPVHLSQCWLNSKPEPPPDFDQIWVWF